MNKTPILKLNNSDDVVIARTELPAGSWLESESMETRDLIPAGHKIALRDIPAGSAVKRYGQIIGFATRDIRQGEHIHVHNLGMGRSISVSTSSGVSPKPTIMPLLDFTPFLEM